MSLTTALSSMDTLNLIALMCVVFIGLPHGAMDGALAAHFGWMESKKKAATFLIGYVAMAALVVGFWFVAPAISFIIFLGISMYHFGKGDVNTDGEEPSVTESLARGGVVIGGISQFHRVDADEIFQVLIGSNTELVWLFLNSVVPMTLIFAILSMVNKTTRERGSLLAEIAGLALIFSIHHFFFGFVIVFVFHSFSKFVICSHKTSYNNR